MKISEITEANTPNIAAMVNGKPVQREAGRDPDSTKPYNKKHKDHNRKTKHNNHNINS
jgi:hypothetical protein